MPRRQWPPREIAADLEPREFKSKAENLLTALKRRELGLPTTLYISDRSCNSSGTKNRIDEVFNKIASSISELGDAIHEKKWEEIERCVNGMLTRLTAVGGVYSEHSYNIPPESLQEKETFVALGGLQLLLQLFEPRLSGTDARNTSPAVMLNRSELWNEVMALLRELVFVIPNMADNFIADCHLSFMFTMLGHRHLFESTMSLVEDILAIKVDTFDLSKVPNLYALLDGFSSRQMMYFCRLLALVLFESEDRQIMECTHVLRSLDLLQLRRDRMAKISNIVERNQCLILQMPRMLEKMILLFKIVNHGPPLSKLVHHNIPQTLTDLLQYVPATWTGENFQREWEMYNYLDELTKKHEHNRPPINKSLSPPRSSPSSSAIVMNEEDQETERVMEQLLSVFSPPTGAASTMMAHILGIMQTASDLNIATITPSNLNPYGIPAVFRRIPRSYHTYREAKNELQFHAMLLIPQQVELLFVMCTLLSGRRKIEVQRRLAELGLANCLRIMYDRLSWGSEPYVGPNPLEHLHGPGCDCNPESAIRVQFLRLVHNFYDRDFIDNPIKDLLLSNTEIQIIRDQPERLLSSQSTLPASSRGLLSNITSTLMNEPYDSIYRFWLLSCIEAFLRGSNKDHQVFVAHSGVIKHTVKHIISIGVKNSGSLQTAFDLLGELTKFNLYLLEDLEKSFEDQEFRDFVDTILANLVDSNVFIRSLYLSLEHFNCSGRNDVDMNIDFSDRSILDRLDDFTYTSESETKALSYLTHTWKQCHPKIISSRAIDEVVVPISSHCSSMAKQDYNGDYKSSRKTSSSKKVPTSPASPHPSEISTSSSLVSIGQGVFNAFKGLHLAAIGFIKCKIDVSANSNNTGIVVEKNTVSTPISSSKTLRINDIEGTEYDDDINEDEENNDIDDNYTKDSDGMDTVDTSSFSTNGIGSSNLPFSPSSPNGSWCLPDSIFRISLFLSSERENILLRLMGTISIHNINHENICCLNTAIVIVVLAHRRDQLSTLLENCRFLLQRHHIPAPALEDKKVTAEFHSNEINLFSNFRKLLWYWREYYLRRGRDRLSLEFSSHLPFKLWSTVVDLLCADDGSPTSLLSRPMKLPRSPYRRLARPSKCNSEFILNLTRPILMKKSVPLDGID